LNAREPLAFDRRVTIVGPASLQNKLLAKLIGERTGYACEVRGAERLNGSASGAMTLALLDASDAARVGALCASGLFPSIALINADSELRLDDFVAYPGVKGVFDADISEEQLVKGIQAIFQGEYWLTRKVLWAHLERTRKVPQPLMRPVAGVLTRKEIETLRLLATGNSTDDIAAALKVSPHTVKTHIYNLFRKIHVSNRLQAAHWAARHLLAAVPRA
jgi:LuxR family transcriptional regulator of csgAB operon